MGFLDALTGASAQRATRDGQQAILNGLSVGTGQLGQGYAAATNALIGPGASAINVTAGARDAAVDSLRGEYGTAQGYLGGLQGLYQPLVSGGASGYNALLDATGANGAAGSARAGDNFRASLGYNAGLDTGLDAVTRSAAARGMAASGNTSRDLFDYAADYQNRQAQGYVSNLSGLLPSYTAGLGGQASGLGAQASTAQGLGTGLAGVYQGAGTQTSGILDSLARYGVQTSAGQAGLQGQAANAYADLGLKGAQAAGAASKNMIDGLFGLGGLALSPMPKGGLGNTLGGSLVGGLGKLFA